MLRPFPAHPGYSRGGSSIGKVIYLSRCSVCDQYAGRGLEIRGVLICRSCELALLFSQVGSRRYEFIRKRLKRIWLAARGRGSKVRPG